MEDNKNFIEDLSCENMEGAYCCSETIANKILKDKEFMLKVFANSFYGDGEIKIDLEIPKTFENLIDEDFINKVT